jgi:hypothetical protein
MGERGLDLDLPSEPVTGKTATEWFLECDDLPGVSVLGAPHTGVASLTQRCRI